MRDSPGERIGVEEHWWTPEGCTKQDEDSVEFARTPIHNHRHPWSRWKRAARGLCGNHCEWATRASPWGYQADEPGVADEWETTAN